MENLIETTAWGILHSLWISALLYGLLQLGLYLIGPERASWRSALAYFTLLAMFAGFVSVFLEHAQFSRVPPPTGRDMPQSDILLLLGKSKASPGIAHMLEPYFPYLVAGYVAGLLLQLSFLVLGLFRIRRLRNKEGLSPVPDILQAIFRQAAGKMGITRQVRVFLSAKVTTPLVVGFLKPMILLPVAIINSLDLQQAELILLHELAHVRRQDYLLNLLKSLIETLLFFNPFVWLCGRIIQAERENACDDMVLRVTSRPLDYAQTLFQVAAHSVRQKPSLALGAIGQHKYHLLQRIKRITNMKAEQNFIRQPFLTVLLAILVAVSLAWIKPQERKIEPSRPVLKTRSYVADTLRDTLNLPAPPPAPTAPKPPVDSVKVPIDIPEPVTFNWDDQSLKIDALSSAIDSLSIKFDADTFLNEVEWNGNEDSIKAYFHSPAWKKQVREIQKLALVNGEKARRNADSLQAYFNSPAWKKQMQEVQKQVGLARIEGEKARKLGDSLRIKFNSPEWKDKIREMTVVYNSPEYKKLKKKFDREVEALKKRKLKNSSN